MSDAKEVKPIQALIPAIILSVFHGVMWIFLLGMMHWYVPAFSNIYEKLIYKELEATLPAATELAILLAYHSINYSYAIVFVIVVLCAADQMLLYALYRRPWTAPLRWIWLALMLFVPLALMAFIVFAVSLSMISLTESLS